MQNIPESLLKANFLSTQSAKKMEVSPPLHAGCRRPLPDHSDTLAIGSFTPFSYSAHKLKIAGVFMDKCLCRFFDDSCFFRFNE